MKKLLYAATLFLLFGLTNNSWAQADSETQGSVIGLMEKIFHEIARDISEIDPTLDRIAVYRIEMGDAIPPALRQHFESRLVELLDTLQEPEVVSLPELNTLRISSTDSTFSVINSLPSPDELWKVSRKLRVDAFIEGNAVYVPGKALFLDLRLNRTGTNEILWSKSYSVYEESIDMPALNPLRKSFNAGIEVFNVDFSSAGDSVLQSGFNNKLTMYSVYFGIYQNLVAESRFRYELRVGISFLSEGAKLQNTFFTEKAFYSNSAGSLDVGAPNSFNFRSMIYGALIENKNNQFGDWLSVYFALTRYFTVRSPDITGLGFGVRTDLSQNFSLSAGLSMILGPEFNSSLVASTNQSVKMKVNGLQYEIFLLQLSF